MVFQRTICEWTLEYEPQARRVRLAAPQWASESIIRAVIRIFDNYHAWIPGVECHYTGENKYFEPGETHPDWYFEYQDYEEMFSEMMAEHRFLEAIQEGEKK